jgi:3-hydroxyisobutyrate dehydrogenase-like beta-hydroxyacid dehydrogenase
LAGEESNGMADRERVGLLGLGLMGTALARRLLGAGFDVVGFDVDAAKREALATLGGTAAESIAAVARASRRVVLAVFNTEQVEAVTEAAGGLLATWGASPPPGVIVCTSTCDPDRIAALAPRVGARGATFLEAPLSGTSDQVSKGDAVGLIAGTHAAFDACADLWDAICPVRHHVGAPGNGGKTKLAVNLILGINRAAVAEGLVFAEQLGLDPATFLRIAKTSAAYSQIMDVKGEKMLRADFLPPHGKVVQALKDHRMMLEYAKRLGQRIPLLEVHASYLQGCVDNGEGEWDNAAVIEDVRRRRQPPQ